jgi:hypothetical protein
VYNREGVCLSSPEDGKRLTSRNIEFSNYLKFWSMDKFQKPSDSECNIDGHNFALNKQTDVRGSIIGFRKRKTRNMSM